MLAFKCFVISFPSTSREYYALHCELLRKAYLTELDGEIGLLKHRSPLSDCSSHLISPPVAVGLERDKFDNKTVTFEEHIKEEHNMWHYLFFIVLVKVKDSTEYTGPESYVAEMIKVELQILHIKWHQPAVGFSIK